jgi:MFS family permease
MRGDVSRRAGRRRAAVLIVALLVVAGGAAGLAWTALAPRVTMGMTVVGPVPVTEEAAGQLVGMDAWYALLGGAVGIVLGTVLATLFLRHGTAMVVSLVVGGCLAAVAALVVGSYVANGSLLLAWHPHAPPGTRLTAPLMLHARGYLLAWPIAVLAPVIPLAWLGWNSGPPGDVARASEPDIHRSHNQHVQDAPPVV